MKRKSIGTNHEMPIQPAFIIGTYNEDGTPDFGKYRRFLHQERVTERRQVMRS